jgi:hypothetical protein
MYSPIALFTYNRPLHTKKTIEALQSNTIAKDSILYIFSDAAKNEEQASKVNEVRKYIQTIQGFKKVIIIERQQNLGLDPSIISGVSEILNRYNKIIVLEDDLITSPVFLEYMNNMLDAYQNTENIYSITGYNYPSSLIRIPSDYQYDVYFNQRAASWGWGTWKDRWESVDWDIQDFDEFKHSKQVQNKFNQGGNDMSNMLLASQSNDLKLGNPWDIRFCYHLFKEDGYCVYPTNSYVSNIGLDGTGVHCGTSDKYAVPVENLSINTDLKLPPGIILDKRIQSNFRNVYNTPLYEQLGKKLLQSLGLYTLYRKIRYQK